MVYEIRARFGRKNERKSRMRIMMMKRITSEIGSRRMRTFCGHYYPLVQHRR